MKQKFSKHWIGSKQPRKQRKYRANAPSHIRHKLMSANLSKELRKKHGKRNFPLKKDDVVKAMKGEFKGKTGKVEILNMQKLKVSVAGINRTKKEGAKLIVWFDPSNLQIQELNLDDKQRIKALSRKAKEKTMKTTDSSKSETATPKSEKSTEDTKDNKKIKSEDKK